MSAAEFNLSDRGRVSVNSKGLGRAGNMAISSDEINLNEGKITATSIITWNDRIKVNEKAEALHQAQLASSHSQDFNHPFYRSPFVLVGKWL